MEKQMLYKYKDNFSYDKPKGTKVVGLEYVQKIGDEVYVCKRRSYFKHVILFLLCLIVGYVYFVYTPEYYGMTYRDTIYVRNGLLELGLKNSGSNVRNALVNLVYQDTPLINTLSVESGEYISNVPLRQVLEPGSYTAKLYYTVIFDFWHVTKAYNVLVIVE